MSDHPWLVLQFESPLLAFGGVMIDQRGETRDFPALSMMTGLLGNALGWRRTDRDLHQRLQDRLVFAACVDPEGDPSVLTDIQNARLEKTDRGWTSLGEPEGRGGASYGAPHRRRRDYLADARVLAVLRLAPGDGPGLDRVADALARPARPLFIGRKCCVPACPVLRPVGVPAATAYQALSALVPPKKAWRAQWPVGEGPVDGPRVHRVIDLADLRNWRSGLHGGRRRVVEGCVEAAPEPAEERS
ncbi:MAG: type I-E CRISPR-associated protein Cas5/CasD [Telmatospirillum sp.]|nr:type I-E CRISPR-associated protein Cas5/CasD [Telmatospirillum sp.]